MTKKSELFNRKQKLRKKRVRIISCVALLFLITCCFMVCLSGCSTHNFQSHTSVLGLECGIADLPNFPLPKVRLGYVTNDMQAIMQGQTAYIDKTYDDINLEGNGGQVGTRMFISPSADIPKGTP